jgi:hypothetical protein
MSWIYPLRYQPETSAAPWTVEYSEIPATHHYWPPATPVDPSADLVAAMHRLAAALEQFNTQRGKK